MIKTYYRMAKPGIVYGNIFVAGAAFVFGSHHAVDASIHWDLFAFMIFGLSLVVGSACVFNNIADRGIDAKMARTASRALAAGTVTPRAAYIYGLILLALGIALLSQTTMLALGAAFAGFIIYVFVYTPMKPHTTLAFYAGAVAGAMPPVVGYAAAANTLDSTALALFIFLALWQVPHFLAIARYRYDEYRAAGIPLLVREPKNEKEKNDARKIFYGSLVVLVLFCAILVVI